MYCFQHYIPHKKYSPKGMHIITDQSQSRKYNNNQSEHRKISRAGLYFFPLSVLQRSQLTLFLACFGLVFCVCLDPSLVPAECSFLEVFWLHFTKIVQLDGFACDVWSEPFCFIKHINIWIYFAGIGYILCDTKLSYV